MTCSEPFPNLLLTRSERWKRCTDRTAAGFRCSRGRPPSSPRPPCAREGSTRTVAAASYSLPSTESYLPKASAARPPVEWQFCSGQPNPAEGQSSHSQKTDRPSGLAESHLDPGPPNSDFPGVCKQQIARDRT